jgi:hypothetical protein
LSEWEAYHILEPIGEERSEFMIAQLCTLVANIMRGKNVKSFSISDFMPRWDGEEVSLEPKKQSAEEMKEIFLNIAKHQKNSSKGIRRKK